MRRVRHAAILTAAFLVLGSYVGGAVFLAQKNNLGFAAALPSLPLSSPSQNQTDKAATQNPPPVVPVTAVKPKTTKKAVSKKHPPALPVGSFARIGIYVSDSPSSQSSIKHLRQASNLGIDTVYNYASYDGTPTQVNHYLDVAKSLNIKVIFSLHDLYDVEKPTWWQQFSQYGTSNESVALNVVRNFSTHPATWGFAISDERPEGPWALGNWPTVLNDRYGKIKAITIKPVMSVHVGYTSSNTTTRRNFLQGLRNTSDILALDYYPVPYMPINTITSVASDLGAIGIPNGWFVAQAFNWNRYPAAAAQQVNYRAGIARNPTEDEMVAMGVAAHAGGARNLMYYSFFDIADDNPQKNALKHAIKRLRGL